MNSNDSAKKSIHTTSTLLVSSHFLELLYIRLSHYKKNQMAEYLHFLLSDKNLLLKLNYMKNGRVKILYQDAGQDLVRLNFLPLDSDWAHLSLLSFSSGCSRCYLFVYLMLLDLGLIAIPIKKNGTPHKKIEYFPNYKLYCLVNLIGYKNIDRKHTE